MHTGLPWFHALPRNWAHAVAPFAIPHATPILLTEGNHSGRSAVPVDDEAKGHRLTPREHNELVSLERGKLIGGEPAGMAAEASSAAPEGASGGGSGAGMRALERTARVSNSPSTCRVGVQNPFKHGVVVDRRQGVARAAQRGRRARR